MGYVQMVHLCVEFVFKLEIEGTLKIVKIGMFCIFL